MTTTATASAVVKHPAKFSDPIVDAVGAWLDTVDPIRRWRILDPFGGVGKVHALSVGNARVTVSSELEPEWAAQGAPRAVAADAIALPFRPGAFDAVFTSPTYANRMADQYAGGGVCRACHGHPLDLAGQACQRCDGEGVDLSTRHTYRVYLGRPLTLGNTGMFGWGPAYRTLHRRLWPRILTAVRPGGAVIVNASDHIRAGKVAPVVEFHYRTLVDAGALYRHALTVETDRHRHGANHDKRVDGEVVMVFQLPR